MSALFAATYPESLPRAGALQRLSCNDVCSAHAGAKSRRISSLAGAPAAAWQSLRLPARTTLRSNAGGAKTSEYPIALLAPPRTHA